MKKGIEKLAFTGAKEKRKTSIFFAYRRSQTKLKKEVGQGLAVWGSWRWRERGTASIVIVRGFTCPRQEKKEGEGERGPESRRPRARREGERRKKK